MPIQKILHVQYSLFYMCDEIIFRSFACFIIPCRVLKKSEEESNKMTPFKFRWRKAWVDHWGGRSWPGFPHGKRRYKMSPSTQKGPNWIFSRGQRALSLKEEAFLVTVTCLHCTLPDILDMVNKFRPISFQERMDCQTGLHLIALIQEMRRFSKKTSGEVLRCDRKFKAQTIYYI